MVGIGATEVVVVIGVVVVTGVVGPVNVVVGVDGGFSVTSVIFLTISSPYKRYASAAPPTSIVPRTVRRLTKILAPNFFHGIRYFYFSQTSRMKYITYHNCHHYKLVDGSLWDYMLRIDLKFTENWTLQKLK